MHTAGARVLREDDSPMSSDREAVLSAWEQKLLVPDVPLRNRPFEREEPDSEAPRRSGRFDRPRAQRRTVTITGRPELVPPPAMARRRRSGVQQQIALQPDRMALWAFFLGLFLVLVAAATANAAPL